MVEVVRKNTEGLGVDCLSCCPTNLECDCDAVSAVYDFVLFMFHKNATEHTDFDSTEVYAYACKLLGFTVKATIEQKFDENGVPCTDFGRTLVESLINTWHVDQSKVQTYMQEMHRVINPFAREYLSQECCCDDDFTQTPEAQIVANILYTIESFAFIGFQGNPANLQEWAEGGICGTCYQDCQGNDFIFQR